MSEEPTFLPREGSPTINVNIRTEPKQKKRTKAVASSEDGEDVVARMWKDQIREDEELEDEADYEDINEDKNDGDAANAPRGASTTTGEENNEPQTDDNETEEEFSSTVEVVKTNTTTTIEYDIVKCADFVLEKGCWVRNMPEEIKRVNPDFVPT